MDDKSNILKQAKQDVFNALEGIIKSYNMRGLSFSTLKKYYKKKKNFDEILEDIRNKSVNLFDDEAEYKKFVKEVLMDMLDDRIAYEKDKKKLKKFESFINESHCKIEKIEKKILGRKYTKNKKIKHKWDLIKIGKFMNTDHDGGTYMVRFKCSECGEEEQIQFASQENLFKIGVPIEIIEEYRDKSFDYSLRFSKWFAGKLVNSIPTTYQDNMDLYNYSNSDKAEYDKAKNEYK